MMSSSNSIYIQKSTIQIYIIYIYIRILHIDVYMYISTLLGTNISHPIFFEDDFPFVKMVYYVSSLEGIGTTPPFRGFQSSSA